MSDRTANPLDQRIFFGVLSGGSSSPEAAVPGEHLVVVGGPQDSLNWRLKGWELRDTFVMLAPDVTHHVFLFRRPLDGTVVDTLRSHGQGALHIVAAPSTEGRWPTNLLLVHRDTCRRLDVGRRSRGLGWKCAGGCPVVRLDEISGPLHARGNKTETKRDRTEGIFPWTVGVPGRVDSGLEGGASKFFPQFASIEAAVEWLLTLLGVRSV